MNIWTQSRNFIRAVLFSVVSIYYSCRPTQQLITQTAVTVTNELEPVNLGHFLCVVTQLVSSHLRPICFRVVFVYFFSWLNYLERLASKFGNDHYVISAGTAIYLETWRIRLSFTYNRIFSRAKSMLSTSHRTDLKQKSYIFSDKVSLQRTKQTTNFYNCSTLPYSDMLMVLINRQ